MRWSAGRHGGDAVGSAAAQFGGNSCIDFARASRRAAGARRFFTPRFLRPDWQSYKGHEYFPQPGDVFMQVGDGGGGFHVKGGGWTFAGPAVPKNGATGGVTGSGDEPNGDECAGWSEGSSDAVDLLSGMMQLVVAAVKGYGQ